MLTSKTVLPMLGKSKNYFKIIFILKKILGDKSTLMYTVIRVSVNFPNFLKM